MKLTTAKLKQIIKEELSMTLEAAEGEEVMQAIQDVPVAAEKIAEKVRSEIEALSEPAGLDPMVLSQAVAALLTAN